MTIVRLGTVALASFVLGCGGAPATPETPAAVASAQGPVSAAPSASTSETKGPAVAEHDHGHGQGHGHGHGHGAPHWSYSGEGGPDRWAELSPEFSACKAGVEQTPVDLSKTAEKAKTLAPIAFDVAKVPVQILNNGHTVQVNNTTTSSVTVAGTRYDLVQFHFHSPSEHTVDGKAFDMELHLVHKNAKGELAVVGVLLKSGKENAALAPAFDNAPADVSKEAKAIAGATIDLATLLPAKAGYYTYKGSLTTPPCSEGVTWYVLSTPSEVSDAQIAKFKNVTHGPTNRPVQKLGARKVLQYQP